MGGGISPFDHFCNNDFDNDLVPLKKNLSMDQVNASSLQSSSFSYPQPFLHCRVPCRLANIWRPEMPPPLRVQRIQNSPHLSDVEHEEQQNHHETHGSSFGGLCIQHSVLRRKKRGQKRDVALNQKLQIPGAHSKA